VVWKTAKCSMKTNGFCSTSYLFYVPEAYSYVSTEHRSIVCLGEERGAEHHEGEGEGAGGGEQGEGEGDEGAPGQPAGGPAAEQGEDTHPGLSAGPASR
jgi:hypothetical protein